MTAPTLIGEADGAWVPASCRVFTPSEVAEAIVKAIGPVAGRWLEPAAGDGVFLDAVEAYSAAAVVHGVELAESSKRADVLTSTDFLGWSASTAERYQVVLGNPPYVALNRVSEPVRAAALGLAAVEGVPAPTLGANLWYAFVLAAMRLLTRGGTMAWLLPASWDFADYAQPMRRAVMRLFREVVVVRSRRALCAGVDDGSVVLLARGFGEGPCARELRAEVKDSSEACEALERLDRRLELPPPEARKPGARSFGDVFDCRIGVVSGQASYFLLSENQRRSSGLPESAMVRVVSRTRHIETPELSRARWDQLRDAGERVWLFRPTGQDVDHAAVRQYLERPQGEGGCNRAGYKVSTRRVWYQAPLLDPAVAFLSPSASSGLTFAPISDATLQATNTLYALSAKGTPSRAETAANLLCLLSTHVTRAASRAARVYAGGLHKLEPSDITALPLPLPRAGIDAESLLRLAIEARIRGEVDLAHGIADEAVQW